MHGGDPDASLASAHIVLHCPRLICPVSMPVSDFSRQWTAACPLLRLACTIFTLLGHHRLSHLTAATSVPALPPPAPPSPPLPAPLSAQGPRLPAAALALQRPSHSSPSQRRARQWPGWTLQGSGQRHSRPTACGGKERVRRRWSADLDSRSRA